jgi:hypothetical protein
MKNALTLFSLGLFAAIASAELARSAGFQAPHILSISNGVIALSVVLLLKLLLADYGAKARPVALPVSRRSTDALRRGSIASAYHHIYAVRRGVEAARLATPNRVVVFPRRAPIHSRHTT